MLTSLLTFFVVGLIGLVAISVVLSIVGSIFGLALGLAGFFLFKVLPVLLIGYVLVRILAPRSRGLSAAEREWLES